MKQTLHFTLLFIFSLLVSTLSIAQEDLAIGQWQAHLPYSTFMDIAQNDEFLFFATEFSLLVMDKEENTIRFASKIDGLSETGIATIGTNEETGLLVIAYTNSVFDLVTPERIIGFSDLRTGGNFNDRSINNMTFEGSRFLYFANGFGVTKFDLEREEFIFTVDMGLSVIDASENINQQDFGAWQLLGSAEGFPPNYLTNFLQTNLKHFAQRRTILIHSLFRRTTKKF